jgi:hypothetical protein
VESLIARKPFDESILLLKIHAPLLAVEAMAVALRPQG